MNLQNNKNATIVVVIAALAIVTCIGSGVYFMSGHTPQQATHSGPPVPFVAGTNGAPGPGPGASVTPVSNGGPGPSAAH
jgi:hypothetical protein